MAHDMSMHVALVGVIRVMKGRECMKSLKKASVAVLTAGALAFGAPQVAFANSAPEDGVAEETIENLTDAANSVEELEENAQSYVLETNNGTIDISKDAEEAITVETKGAGEENLEIGLPFADVADDAEVGDAGQIEFDNNNQSTTSVLPYDEGSLQIVTTILDASAPQEYEYEINLPENGSYLFQEDGSVLLLDAEGNLFAGAAAPWAKDDAGKDVPTHFEMRDNVLVQVVEHTSVKDVAYPVVADPWLGSNLFAWITRTTMNGDYRYNGKVSNWGRVILSGGASVGGVAAGQAIMKTSGWNEWKAKYPAITNKATLKQQYECHVTGIVFPLDGTYNLERYRANKSNWSLTVWKHKCNW